jgi:hypothetical protein
MSRGLRYVLSEVGDNYRSFNWWRNRVFVRYVLGTLSRLHPAYPGYDEAVDVPSAEWDNLIVLDACRADAFERVVDTDRFDEYWSVVSAGSHSSEWTRRNFAGDEFGDIVYVSANPHTSKLAGDSFHDVVEMWNTAFDESAGTVLPDAMADAARDTADRHPDKRLVVHFMQPHGPFVGSDVPETAEDDRYWEAYDQNLAYVMDSVDELVADLSGRTVITADHGQIAPSPLRDAVGVSGHKPGLRHPGVVVVPWAVIDGDRRETVDGETNSSTAEAVDDRLRDLGYKV